MNYAATNSILTFVPVASAIFFRRLGRGSATLNGDLDLAGRNGQRHSLLRPDLQALHPEMQQHVNVHAQGLQEEEQGQSRQHE
jgi:hypothetical protein